MGEHTSSPLPITSSRTFCGDGMDTNDVGHGKRNGKSSVLRDSAFSSVSMLCISPAVGPLVGLPGTCGTLRIPSCVDTALGSLIYSGK